MTPKKRATPCERTWARSAKTVRHRLRNASRANTKADSYGKAQEHPSREAASGESPAGKCREDVDKDEASPVGTPRPAEIRRAVLDGKTRIHRPGRDGQPDGG